MSELEVTREPAGWRRGAAVLAGAAAAWAIAARAVPRTPPARNIDGNIDGDSGGETDMPNPGGR
ncbi:hypothetical protein [Paraburkholderia sp.]|uniref:hypothetical protein n=1 Tax=Paraburkholderia sp. TaxID=1926495 RepID=UPI0025E56BCB|nr:hypothetical protein [Paraburkholderia sp.]